MKAGIFRAKVISSGLGLSKEKQTPYINLDFIVQVTAEVKENISWQGYLSEKAVENTEKALLVLGWNKSYEDLVDDKGLDKNKIVELTIEEETPDKGKIYCKVKWINEVGSSGNQKAKLLDRKEAILVLGKLGLVKKTSLSESVFTSEDIAF